MGGVVHVGLWLCCVCGMFWCWRGATLLKWWFCDGGDGGVVELRFGGVLVVLL